MLTGNLAHSSMVVRGVTVTQAGPYVRDIVDVPGVEDETRDLPPAAPPPSRPPPLPGLDAWGRRLSAVWKRTVAEEMGAATATRESECTVDRVTLLVVGLCCCCEDDVTSGSVTSASNTPSFLRLPLPPTFSFLLACRLPDGPPARSNDVIFSTSGSPAARCE